MHSLHDDLLPLYHTLTISLFDRRKSDVNRFASLPKLTNLNLFLFDDYHKIDEDPFTKHFYSTVFKNVNLFYKADFKVDNQLICFEDAEIGLDRATVWYDYGFKRYQTSIDKTPYEKHLIRLYTNEIRNLILRDDRRSCDEHYATFISRRRSRLVLNEDQLIDQLNNAFGYAVQRIDLDNDLQNLEPLIRTLTCSKVLIGMHGAGLILSIFLPANANLIELFPYKLNASYYTPYKQLASIFGLNYANWTNKWSSNSFYNLAYLKEEIKQQIYADQEVEQSVCCDEPYFLFRVYQDTVVHLDEMNELFRKVKESEIRSKDDCISIAPSKVQITCSRANQTIRLEWTRPWNLIQSLDDVEYDVLVSGMDNVSKMYQTKDTRLVISTIDREQILVWIRAKQNGSLGPFDDKPIYCK